MANRRPLVHVSGSISELRAGETIAFADIEAHDHAGVYLPASAWRPLLLRASALLASTRIPEGLLVVTPAPASIPSGVVVTVEPQAEWLLMAHDQTLLEYDQVSGRWSGAQGGVREVVGRVEPQTLEHKTLAQPVLQDPAITGGSIQGAQVYLDAAVTHSHTVDSAAHIPPGSHALSVAPITILSGGSVTVGAGSIWKFLWI